MVQTLTLWVFLIRICSRLKGGMEDPLLHSRFFMDTSRPKESENSCDEDGLSLLLYGCEDPEDQHLPRIEGLESLPHFPFLECVEGSGYSGPLHAPGVDTTSEETPPTILSLPEFEQLLPADHPKPRQRSKSPKKTTKRTLTVPSSPGPYPVTKRRHILPKTPAVVSLSQPTSGSISQSSLESLGTVFTGEASISDSPFITTVDTPVASEELEIDESPVDPQPGPSGEQARRLSDIPLTFDSSSSSSEGSPTLAATTEEVVKVFVYGEDEGVKKAAVASEQSMSFMPLIKEELRTKIQLKRLLSGDEEAEVEFKKPDFKMSLDEVKKREKKKEQNRRAALRSRQRQSQQEEEIIQKHSQLEKEKKTLIKEKQRLLEEKKSYIETLTHHIDTECQLFTREEDKQKIHQFQGSSTQTQ